MPSASNAKLQYESSQETVSYSAMTDSGDHLIFTATDPVWSKRSGFTPTVRPNGIVSGSNLVSATTTEDEVQCAAFTMYAAGTLVSVSADSSIAFTRDASLDYQKFSVVSDAAGSLTIIESTAHASAFSTTRGAAGGPPAIPLASIEIAQIWVTDKTSAVVVATEIKQSPEAQQQERYDFPVFDYDSLGEGNKATDSDKTNAFVEFASAIPMVHGATAASAADNYKPVYIEYSTPVYVTIKAAVDFVPAETSTSSSSTQYYRKSYASSSDSLGSGSFTALVDDGISGTFEKLDGENIIFKFYPDENNAPYSLTQGIFRKTTTYAVDNNISISATIAAEQETVGFDS